MVLGLRYLLDELRLKTDVPINDEAPLNRQLLSLEGVLATMFVRSFAHYICVKFKFALVIAESTGCKLRRISLILVFSCIHTLLVTVHISLLLFFSYSLLGSCVPCSLFGFLCCIILAVS